MSIQAAYAPLPSGGGQNPQVQSNYIPMTPMGVAPVAMVQSYVPMQSVSVTMLDPPQPIDTMRSQVTYAGRLAGSARMDYDQLKCFYRFCQFDCCISDSTVRRTFVDVYDNRIVANVPWSCCCGCCSRDRVTTLFFDRLADDLKGGGCCRPCPYCCPHCCDCCGETLILSSCCGCPLGIGHWSATLGCCCCPIDVIAGLQPGEASRISEIIARQRREGLAWHLATHPNDLAVAVAVQYNLAARNIRVTAPLQPVAAVVPYAVPPIPGPLATKEAGGPSELNAPLLAQ